MWLFTASLPCKLVMALTGDLFPWLCASPSRRPSWGALKELKLLWDAVSGGEVRKQVPVPQSLDELCATCLKAEM